MENVVDVEVDLDTLIEARNEYRDIAELIFNGEVAGLSDPSPAQWVGMELEGLFTKNGMPAFGAAQQLLPKLAASIPGATQEFLSCAWEHATKPVPWADGAGLQALEHMLRRDEQLARGIAQQELGVAVTSMGFLPTFDLPDFDDPKRTITPHPRYEQVLGLLGGMYPRPNSFELAGPNGSIRFTSKYRPIVAGSTTGSSLNIQVSPSILGKSANFLLSIAWLLSASASTSPFALGRRGEWSSRARIWRYGLTDDGSLSPFGIGNYYEQPDLLALKEWIEFVMTGKRLTGADGVKKPGGCFPVLQQLGGTRWTNTHRLRMDRRDNKLVVWIEVRVADRGLSVLDDIADAALTIGLMIGLARVYESASPISLYADAEANYWAAARLGRHAKIRWEGKMHSVEHLLFDKRFPELGSGGVGGTGLLDVADAGLRQCGVPQHLRSHWLGTIATRFQRGRTGTELMDKLMGKITRLNPSATPMQSCAELVDVLTRVQGLENCPRISEWEL